MGSPMQVVPPYSRINLLNICTMLVQAQTRTGMVESSSNGAPATAGSREADLENQVKHLREELTFAQETAAAAQGHSKQYESLAKSSDEAVKAMQVLCWTCSSIYQSDICATT